MQQARRDETREWMKHPLWPHRSGALQRLLQAWWILTGRWSLHRAWQAGKDLGGQDEWRRIMVNGGDLGPVIDAAIYATSSCVLRGTEPQAAMMGELRRRAFARYSSDFNAMMTVASQRK
jgi:hypothetical protein